MHRGIITRWLGDYKKDLAKGVLFVALLFFCIHGLMPVQYQAIFLLYAIFIFAMLHTQLSNPAETENIPPLSRRFGSVLTVGALILFTLSRAIPFLRYGPAPLGYDTGFYLQYFATIIPAGRISDAILTGSIAYTPWFPLHYLGFSGLTILDFLHLLHQVMLLGAVYFLLHSLPFGKRSMIGSAVGIFLFSISITQFMGFWWMFYKQSMALPFLILALGLFLRQSWLAIPIAAVGAAIHLQSAIPFGVAFTLFLVWQIVMALIERRPIDRELWILTLGGALAALLLIIIKGPQDLLGYLTYFQSLGGLASNAPDGGAIQAQGLFIPFSTARLNLLFILPFGLLGVLNARRWLWSDHRSRNAFLLILFVVSLILSAFPFIYQNRSLVVLDLIFIVLATYPATLFVERCMAGRTDRATLSLLGFGLVLWSTLVITNQPPQLYPDERLELTALEQRIRPGKDYAMATSSIYTPWVFAFTNFRDTIAPGWLFWNKWDYPTWQKFWLTSNDQERDWLLEAYGPGDIYMFVGRHQQMSLSFQRFLKNDAHVQPVSPHIWRYSQTIQQTPPPPLL